jgi:peroxiredoxin
MPHLIAPLLLLIFAGNATAEHTVTTDEGDEIPVSIYPAGGDRLVVWLTSEFGVTPRRTALAEALARQGVEVWAPDLHAAWFLPSGRYSLNEVDPAVVGAILSEAIETRHKQVFLMAEGRTVALALNGVRRWQTDSDNTESLRGLLAFSPRLFLRTPQGGEAAEYLPIAGASNLPVYILQPEDSGGFWRMAQDIRELEKGGSMVFAHRLPGVSDGFHARPEFSEAERAMTARLPEMLVAAMAQLEPYGGTPRDPAPMETAAMAPQKPVGNALLRPYAAQRKAPALRLPSLDGSQIDLSDMAGKVVLVNFWATWCPPCVEEIPSLQRLYRRLQPQGLEILAVDVGESAETMKQFLKDKPVSFPVLMDTQGDALQRWGIYAFPTTLVLDREHRVRYAVFGAFDWSSQEVLDTLSPLLAQDSHAAADRDPR